jgi:uncharacterized membrane protein YqjE
MLLIVALIVFVVWVIGFGFFRAAVGGVIHILLLIAIIALAWHFLSGHAREANTPATSPVTAPSQ